MLPSITGNNQNKSFSGDSLRHCCKPTSPSLTALPLNLFSRKYFGNLYYWTIENHASRGSIIIHKQDSNIFKNQSRTTAKCKFISPNHMLVRYGLIAQRLGSVFKNNIISAAKYIFHIWYENTLSDKPHTQPTFLGHWGETHTARFFP